MLRFTTLRLLIFLFLSTVFELAVAPSLKVAGAQPAVVYLAVVYAALEWNFEAVLVTAVWAGIFREFAGSAPLGVEFSTLVLGAFLLILIIQKIEHVFLIFRIAIAFFFVVAVRLLHLIYCAFLGCEIPGRAWIFTALFGSALYSALFVPLVFYLAAHWFKNHRMLRQLELFGHL